MERGGARWRGETDSQAGRGGHCTPAAAVSNASFIFPSLSVLFFLCFLEKCLNLFICEDSLEYNFWIFEYFSVHIYMLLQFRVFILILFLFFMSCTVYKPNYHNFVPPPSLSLSKKKKCLDSFYIMYFRSMNQPRNIYTQYYNSPRNTRSAYSSRPSQVTDAMFVCAHTDTDANVPNPTPHIVNLFMYSIYSI